MFGFLNVDKPAGLTSHDVVAQVRRALKIRQVGHAGTLDPLATGVLVICVGPATRLSEYVMDTTKRYRATLRLGVTTTTYDAEGEITAERDPSAITREMVEALLPRFTGDLAQIPPMYSAIKQGGRKLYELARAGQTVERPPRPVHIAALTLVEWSPPFCVLDVTCSAGTYIRSLAYDLGEALGVGAHLTALVRTASGSFTLENAAALDTLLADAEARLVAPQAALAHLPVITLDEAEADAVLHGRSIPATTPAQRVLAVNEQGGLLAVLEHDERGWHPRKVFHP